MPITKTQNLLKNVVGIWAGNSIYIGNGSNYVLLFSKSDFATKFPGAAIELSAVDFRNGDYNACNAIPTGTVQDSSGIWAYFDRSVPGMIRIQWQVVGISA